MQRGFYSLIDVPASIGAWILKPFWNLILLKARFLWLVRLRSRAKGAIPVTTQFDGPVYAEGQPRLDLGEHCRLSRGVHFETTGSGSITLGGHVRVNRGTVIVSASKVIIGDGCLIGEYVSIRDADHGMAPGSPMRLQTQESAPITIGEDVWLARGVAVLKGVTIGDGAVIGANSVVKDDIPSMALAVGSPAKVVRYRTEREAQQ